MTVLRASTYERLEVTTGLTREEVGSVIENSRRDPGYTAFLKHLVAALADEIDWLQAQEQAAP